MPTASCSAPLAYDLLRVLEKRPEAAAVLELFLKELLLDEAENDDAPIVLPTPVQPKSGWQARRPNKTDVRLEGT